MIYSYKISVLPKNNYFSEYHSISTKKKIEKKKKFDPPSSNVVLYKTEIKLFTLRNPIIRKKKKKKIE